MLTAEDLKEFCADENRNNKYDLTRPHTFEHHRNVYSCATDGQRLVVVDGAIDGLTPESLPITQYLIEPQGVRVNCADLKAFLECDKPTMRPCKDCGGSGKIQPSHSCNCAYCDRGGPVVPCDCYGTLQRVTNYGWLGIAPFNRALLAEPMRTCEDETVLVYIEDPHGAFHVFASDRHIACMPMLVTDGHGFAPRFEVKA